MTSLRDRLPRPSGRRVRRVAVVAAGLAIFGGTGVAYAAWTSSGTGVATAKAGAALSPTTTTVPGTAITTGLLYPGLAGDAVITVNNPNPYPVKVATVAGNGAVTATGGIGSCVNHTVSFSNRTSSCTPAPSDS